MKPGRGKAKGGAYERHICKLLSLWVTGGKHEDVFWRSAMSGGRATVRNRKGKKINVRQAGDITAVAPEGHVLTDNFYIETKHVRNLGLDNFIIRRTGPLAKFWEIAFREATKHGRIPVIIARQNGWPDIVITFAGEFNTNSCWFAEVARGSNIHLARLVDVTATKPNFKAFR